MGGVDLRDRLISYYSMMFRTKRWPTRVIFHLLSMSVVNSWMEYRERELKKGVSRKLAMDLLSFRPELADSLCKIELRTIRFRGRPSMRSLLNYTPIPRKKTPASVLPTAEVRHDGFDHWPEAMRLKSAQRCRLEHCGKSGQIRCQNFPDMSLDQTVLEHEFKCVFLCLFVCIPLVLVTKKNTVASLTNS